MNNDETKNILEVEEEEVFNELIRIRRDKLKNLKDSGKNPFDVYKVNIDRHAKDVYDDFEKFENTEIKIAGRIRSKRGHGKAIFADVYDSTGKLQVYVNSKEVSEDKHEEFKTLDIGDIIAVTGIVFKSKMGEITIRVSDFTLLAKSLKPLPEKFHGLKDPDLRYRQREVDMIVNEKVRDVFVKRAKIIKEIRNYLDDRGYLEAETPMLSSIAGGASARPFITHHNTLDMDMYLRIATELHLKRLIIGGFDKVYDMGRIFRNEGMDIKHNPEFTTIELYEAYSDYTDMMELVENLVAHVSEIVTGSTKVDYEGTEIDFKPPWRRLTMVDAVKEYTGVDFNEIKDNESARKVAKENHLKFKKELKETTKGDILNAMFEEFVEEKLIQPTFILDYPVENSPLTKAKRGNPEYVERFEGFVYAREICNAYSELNDPIVQRERFEQQEKERELGDDEAYVIDEDFMSAMEIGMPPMGGVGIGIDRLVMFLTNTHSIRDVIMFPTMKPLLDK